MRELRRECHRGEKERGRHQRHRARNGLTSPGGGTQRPADDHGRRGHLDEVWRREQDLEPEAARAESRSPDRIVEEPGRAEDERRRERAGFAVREGAIPGATGGEPCSEAGEKVERQQRPGGDDDRPSGLRGRLEDFTRLVDVRKRHHVGAKNEAGRQDDDDRVDKARFFDQTPKTLHAPIRRKR